MPKIKQKNQQSTSFIALLDIISKAQQLMVVENRPTMSEGLDSHLRRDARVAFMLGPSYLLASDKSLQWAADSLTWPWRPG